MHLNVLIRKEKEHLSVLATDSVKLSHSLNWFIVFIGVIIIGFQRRKWAYGYLAQVWMFALMFQWFSFKFSSSTVIKYVLLSCLCHFKVSGDFIDRALTSRQRSTYTSALFYASWCPFSRRIHFMFEALSSMYPQIEHLAIEQSSAMPRWENAPLCQKESVLS